MPARRSHSVVVGRAARRRADSSGEPARAATLAAFLLDAAGSGRGRGLQVTSARFPDFLFGRWPVAR